MNRRRAEQVADVLVVTAAVSVAWVVLRDPRGRRLATSLLRRFLTSDAPRFLAREVRHAWEATA